MGAVIVVDDAGNVDQVEKHDGGVLRALGSFSRRKGKVGHPTHVENMCGT